MKILKFLEPFKFKKLLFGTAFFLIVQTIAALALPVPFKIMLNQIFDEETDVSGPLSTYSTTEQIYILFAIFSVLAMVELFAQHMAGRLGQPYAIKTALNLGRKILAGVDRAKLSYIEKVNSSQMVLVMTRDVRNVESVLFESIQLIFVSIPSIIFILVMVGLSSTPLFIVCLLSLVFNLSIITHFSKELRREQRRERDCWGHWYDELADSLRNMFTIKSLGINKSQFILLNQRLDTYDGIRKDAERAQVWYQSSSVSSQSILRAALLLIGGLAVARKEMTPGDLILWYTYFRMLRPHLMSVSRILSRIQKTRISWGFLTKYYDELSAEQESVEGIDLVDEKRNSLSFESLQLRSKSEDHNLFKALSFEATSGDLICLAGPSGVGKSTLAYTILGLTNETYDGQISWNGKDLRDYHKIKLRQSIGYCPQSTEWMHRSLRENLIIAVDGESDEGDMEDLVENLNLSQLFENGLTYETTMGDGGREISGGEKQRLSLIRTLLRKDIPIYIFDEPTASLDKVSADEVRKQMLSKAREGSIIILFSHNRDDWEICDRLIHLEPQRKS